MYRAFIDVRRDYQLSDRAYPLNEGREVFSTWVFFRFKLVHTPRAHQLALLLTAAAVGPRALPPSCEEDQFTMVEQPLRIWLCRVVCFVLCL